MNKEIRFLLEMIIEDYAYGGYNIEQYYDDNGDVEILTSNFNYFSRNYGIYNMSVELIEHDITVKAVFPEVVPTDKQDGMNDISKVWNKDRRRHNHVGGFELEGNLLAFKLETSTSEELDEDIIRGNILDAAFSLDNAREDFLRVLYGTGI